MYLITYLDNHNNVSYAIVAQREVNCLKICPIIIKKKFDKPFENLPDNLNYEILNKKYKFRISYKLKTILKEDVIAYLDEIDNKLIVKIRDRADIS